MLKSTQNRKVLQTVQLADFIIGSFVMKGARIPAFGMHEQAERRSGRDRIDSSTRMRLKDMAISDKCLFAANLRAAPCLNRGTRRPDIYDPLQYADGEELAEGAGAGCLLKKTKS